MKKLAPLLLSILFVSCSMNQANSFSITSNIKPNSTISHEHVFNGFGCLGKNISPEISWKNPPKGTKSFALTVYDPDAPTGSGWWHWSVINIPANYDVFPANFGYKNSFSLEANINQIRNDFGNYSFGGPCPPKGDKKHRYIFTIHALKTEKIDLDKSATAALAGFMINQNTLAKSSFTAFYSR